MKVSVDLLNELIEIEKKEAIKDVKAPCSSGWHEGAIQAYKTIKKGLSVKDVIEMYRKYDSGDYSEQDDIVSFNPRDFKG